MTFEIKIWPCPVTHANSPNHHVNSLQAYKKLNWSKIEIEAANLRVAGSRSGVGLFLFYFIYFATEKNTGNSDFSSIIDAFLYGEYEDLWGFPNLTKFSFIPCLYFYRKLTVSYVDAPTVTDACSLCLGINLSTDA